MWGFAAKWRVSSTQFWNRWLDKRGHLIEYLSALGNCNKKFLHFWPFCRLNDLSHNLKNFMADKKHNHLTASSSSRLFQPPIMVQMVHFVSQFSIYTSVLSLYSILVIHKLHIDSAFSASDWFPGVIAVHIFGYLEQINRLQFCHLKSGGTNTSVHFVLWAVCLQQWEYTRFNKYLNLFTGDAFHRVMLPTKHPTYFSPKHNRSVGIIDVRFCSVAVDLLSLPITSPQFRVNTIVFIWFLYEGIY